MDAYRKSFEEDKARIKQDLLVVEMKVEKEKASLEREKERQEKEQKRLSEENALLAVRAGEEIDRSSPLVHTCLWHELFSWYQLCWLVGNL